MAESTRRNARRPDETFRLQAIPAHLDKAGVHDLLRQRLGNNVKARVHSLACSPESPREKTATLQFLELPELLLKDGESDKDEWALNLPDELEGPVLDNHFRGMTPLHSSDDSKCTVDLFALSGLGSHAFGSFKKRNEPYMWLRDSLSRDLPHLRIFTFGYESRLVGSQSFQNINDLAIKFRNALSEVQSVDASRPSILLGHSLGGIVLKQAILQISDCNHLGVTRLEAVLGILLFGVPNQGMDVKSLVPMVGDQPNRYLVDSLGQSSEILRHQEQTFQKVFDSTESMVFSFFETAKSPTAQKVGDRWCMSGEPAVLVDRYSATHCRPWETGDFYVYPVNRTHSEMVKFTSSQDEYYKVVKGRLNRLVMNRNEMVRRRNPELRQPKGAQESECLRSFSFELRNERLSMIAEAAGNTCAWILSHQRYGNWNNRPHGILWIKGKPGSGKSTLMKYIFRELQSEATVSGFLLATFFVFGQGFEMQRSQLGLFRSVLHQLLSEPSSPLEELSRRYSEACRTRGQHRSDWDWSVEEVKRYLVLTIRAVLDTRPVVLLVDALDELGESSAIEVGEFFQELIETHGTDLKICFSCRHYPILTIDDEDSILLEHENQQDISHVMSSKLRNVPRQENLTRFITQKADGVFQWAILVASQIRNRARIGRSFELLQKSVEELPKDLHKLYADILKNPDKDTVKLLQWVCFAERPLTARDLRHAIAVDASSKTRSLRQHEQWFGYGESANDLERMVKHISRGLAETGGGHNGLQKRVRFIHQSVAEYLRNGGLPVIDGYPVMESIEQAHFQLCRTCITYLGLEEIQHYFEDCLKRHLDRQCMPCTDITQHRWRNIINDLRDENTGSRLMSKFPLLLYASRHWPKHAQLIHRFDNVLHPLLDCFTSSQPAVPSILATNGGMESLVGLSSFDITQWNWALSTLFLAGPQASGTTLLHEMVRSGQSNATNLLLSLGNVEVNATDIDETPPLFVAVTNNNFDMLRCLLMNGANVNFEAPGIGTAFYLAATLGFEHVMNVLKEAGANINPRLSNGATLLSRAILTDDIRGVDLLIRLGVQVDSQDDDGSTPAMVAAGSDDRKGSELLKLLIAADADLNKGNYQGATPLSLASMRGNLGIVRQLLTVSHVDVDPEATTGTHMTPLLLAARAGHWETVRLLLDARQQRHRQHGLHPSFPQRCLEDLEQAVVGEAFERLGRENENTLLIMEEFSKAYLANSKLSSSERLILHVCQLRSKNTAKDHPAFLTTMFHKASIYWRQGRWKDAEDTDRQVLAMRRRTLGIYHNDTIMSMRRLAEKCNSQDLLIESQQLEMENQRRARVRAEDGTDTETSSLESKPSQRFKEPIDPLYLALFGEPD